MVNCKFLKEARALEARWGKLLNGVEDKYIRSVTAVLLENQRLMNEQPFDESKPFVRLQIPLWGGPARYSVAASGKIELE